MPLAPSLAPLAPPAAVRSPGAPAASFSAVGAFAAAVSILGAAGWVLRRPAQTTESGLETELISFVPSFQRYAPSNSLHIHLFTSYVQRRLGDGVYSALLRSHRPRRVSYVYYYGASKTPYFFCRSFEGTPMVN